MFCRITLSLRCWFVNIKPARHFNNIFFFFFRWFFLTLEYILKFHRLSFSGADQFLMEIYILNFLQVLNLKITLIVCYTASNRLFIVIPLSWILFKNISNWTNHGLICIEFHVYLNTQLIVIYVSLCNISTIFHNYATLRMNSMHLKIKIVTPEITWVKGLPKVKCEIF